MAKKKQKQKQPKAKERKRFLKDERIRFTLGLFTILLSVYLTVAFVSYLFTWKVDQSFEWQSVFSGSSIRVNNWAGKVGASLASQFMNRWFGISSLAFPVIIFLGGLKLLKIRTLSLKKVLYQLLWGIVLLSLVLGFVFETTNGYLGSGLGGRHGLFVTTWLNSFIGKMGTALLLIILSFGYIVYLNENILFWVKRLAHKVKQRLQKKSADEEAQVDDVEQPESETPTVEFGSIKPSFNGAIDLNGGTQIETLIKQKPEKEEEQAKKDVEPTQKEEDDGISFDVERGSEEELDINLVEQEDFYDPTLELSKYQRPMLELLEERKSKRESVSDEELLNNKNKILETLKNYGIEISRILATVGPTVTLYEIVPAPGVRISKIKNLEDDIALSLAALGIRIIAPIPGKGTIGIEVPNRIPEIVSMQSILRSPKFQDNKFDLAIALGKTISDETYVVDLAKMPHLLVAGATGQGKSVGLNAIITSLLYKKHPAQLKFVLIDPKKVELTLYNKLERHFLAKLPDTEEAIITDTQKVINTLNSLCIEMDSRYDLLKAAQVRNIKEYNQKFIERRLNPNKGHKFLPYIVVIIDEFADLIMTAGREIEGPIQRLAQLARAIGIHLIIATQRPTTNIITGVIKANFPARMAFRVTSMIDSRTILDTPGANQLIGKGDMLVSAGSDLVRVQCAFVDTPEVERITDFIGNQKGYASAFILPEYVGETSEAGSITESGKLDDLFEDAARLLVSTQQGSTSLIQRRFSIGYNRAGRIIDQLEAMGIVGPPEGSKARQVLIQDEASLDRLLSSLEDSGE